MIIGSCTMVANPLDVSQMAEPGTAPPLTRGCSTRSGAIITLNSSSGSHSEAMTPVFGATGDCGAGGDGGGGDERRGGEGSDGGDRHGDDGAPKEGGGD